MQKCASRRKTKPSQIDMDVSVIIVTRNTCALTRLAVQSVQDSSGSLTKEIFVVDNGSTDETPSALPAEFPKLKLIRSETNLGFARACNLAARQASGEFLLLLNSDARPQPDALARAVAWLRANSDCAVAGGQLLNPGGSRQNSIANFPTLATQLMNKSLLRRLRPKKFPGKEQIFAAPIEVESIVGAFMLVRKLVWDALGGLDERFFFFFEETDFCLRARRARWKIIHLPDVLVEHGQGKTAGQIPSGARIEYWRSRGIYFAKNHSPFARRFLAAGLMVRLVFDLLAASVLTVVTLGKNSRWQNRRRVCAALFSWHLRGCPAKDGLPR
jgi:GT2 family glycosyltransferase